MGGAERVAKHRDKGKLDVRARIDRLLDKGSFHELGTLAGGEIAADGIVVGSGMLNGSPVMVGAEDFTTLAGVQALFDSQGGATIGWIHYLAFDLFVGIWVARNADRHGYLRIVQIPILFFVFMAGPFTLPAIMLPPIADEITLGNIHAFMGLAVIAGLRWPGFWAFMLLTKVTPGVGLLWFVFRREWRSLAIAIGVTAAIATAPTTL
jgi:hypothetical protein